jgi:hypothetical protein
MKPPSDFSTREEDLEWVPVSEAVFPCRRRITKKLKTAATAVAIIPCYKYEVQSEDRLKHPRSAYDELSRQEPLQTESSATLSAVVMCRRKEIVSTGGCRSQDGKEESESPSSAKSNRKHSLSVFLS